MVVRTAPRASPLLEALVVTLHDGRPGFSARFAEVRQVEGAPLLLYAEGAVEPTHTGLANVLRSGAAYDEVRGRTRAAEPWWARGARRADNAVVVLEIDGPQAGND
ncbi:hypothetical protein GCM10027448_18320 [Nocardioides dilutus]